MSLSEEADAYRVARTRDELRRGASQLADALLKFRDLQGRSVKRRFGMQLDVRADPSWQA